MQLRNAFWRAGLLLVFAVTLVPAFIVANESRFSGNPVETENTRSGSSAFLSPNVRSMIDAAGEREPGEEAENQADNKAEADLHAGGGGAAPSASGLVDASGPIVGYAGQQSVNVGQRVDLHVRSGLGQAFDVVVYRIGWNGGTGAREVRRIANLPAGSTPTSAPDALGTVELSWPVSTVVDTAGFTSGYYLAALNPAGSDATSSYVPFVVRNDSQPADVVVSIPFNTYQAYNYWGGRSLYTSPPAQRVSFDRPYANNMGTQFLFAGDYQMITMLEREGVNVTYITNIDMHRNPGILANRKLLMAAYHDEYWSRPMYDTLVSALAASTSAAFLSANNIYWQVRFEPSAGGVVDRRMVSYKNAVDPMSFGSTPWLTTTLFREPIVGLPELRVLGAALHGSSFGPSSTTSPWKVANANHWIYSGTGLQNGDLISGLVGGEWDSSPVGRPADATIISDSVSPTGTGSGQNGVVRDLPSGRFVFNASTIRFGLYVGVSSLRDTRVERMVLNLVARAKGI